MSILALPMSLDDLELAWLKESYAEGYGKLANKVISARNYVLNPNAEVDTTNVLALSSVVSRDTVTKFSGAASYKCVTDGVTANGGILFVLSVNRPADKKWRGGIRINLPVGASAKLIYRHKDAVSPSRDYSSVDVVGNNAWQYIETPASIAETAPDNTNSNWLGVRINGSAATTFYVEEAILVARDTVPTYFDGSTADTSIWTYDWEGAANASSSIKWSAVPMLPDDVTVDVNARSHSFLELSYWSKISGLAGPATVNDHKLTALKTKVIAPIGNTIGDLWVQYLRENSGLVGNYSLADHELAFYKSQLGL